MQGNLRSIDVESASVDTVWTPGLLVVVVGNPMHGGSQRATLRKNSIGE
jgi:hypothetical protein